MDAKKLNVILDNFEEKSPELYYHCERVAMISYAFAKEINLSYEDRELAYFSGILHDIGKFYSENILDDEIDDLVAKIINGSMIYFDNDFAKLIPIISEGNLNKENKNIDIIRLIVQLANEYDELRNSGITHENACKIIRSNDCQYNDMVTILFKTIIKNQLNYEY